MSLLSPPYINRHGLLPLIVPTLQLPSGTSSSIYHNDSFTIAPEPAITSAPHWSLLTKICNKTPLIDKTQIFGLNK